MLYEEKMASKNMRGGDRPNFRDSYFFGQVGIGQVAVKCCLCFLPFYFYSFLFSGLSGMTSQNAVDFFHIN